MFLDNQETLFINELIRFDKVPAFLITMVWIENFLCAKLTLGQAFLTSFGILAILAILANHLWINFLWSSRGWFWEILVSLKSLHHIISNDTKFAWFGARSSKLHPREIGCLSWSLKIVMFIKLFSSGCFGQTKDALGEPRHTVLG